MKSILASYIISETEDRIRKSLLQLFFHSLDDLFFSGSPLHFRVYPFYGHILPFSVISSQHLYQNEFNLEQRSLAEVWGSAVWIYQPKLPRDSSIVCCPPSSLISPQSGQHLLSQAGVCISLEMCKRGMSNLHVQANKRRAVASMWRKGSSSCFSTRSWNLKLVKKRYESDILDVFIAFSLLAWFLLLRSLIH